MGMCVLLMRFCRYVTATVGFTLLSVIKVDYVPYIVLDRGPSYPWCDEHRILISSNLDETESL
jgi:hypothetical protein